MSGCWMTDSNMKWRIKPNVPRYHRLHGTYSGNGRDEPQEYVNNATRVGAFYHKHYVTQMFQHAYIFVQSTDFHGRATIVMIANRRHFLTDALPTNAAMRAGKYFFRYRP